LTPPLTALQQAQMIVDAALKPQQDLLNQQAAAARQEAAFRAQAIQGFSLAGANALKSVGPDIGSAYNAAADRTAAYGHGYSTGLQLLAQQSADQGNQQLEKLGLPGRVNGDVQGGADALYAIGGAIPATSLATQGAAFRSAADFLPATTIGRGQQDFALAQAQGVGNQRTFDDQLKQLEAQRPGLLNQALSTIGNQADSRAKVNTTLSAGRGILVNDYGDAIKGKNGKPIPYAPYEKPAGPGGFKIVKGSDGYYRVNSDGTVSPLGIKPPPTAGSKPSNFQSKVVNGHVVTFDPNTNQYYVPGTTTPIDPNSLSKPPTPASPKQMQAARNYLFDNANGYWASTNDLHTILTPAQATAAKAAGEDVQYVNVTPHEDNEIQRLYTTLVKKYGIPARQAFTMVAGQYKQWGSAHEGAYFPKAGAADSGIRVQGATAKDAAAVDLVKQYLGTPYQWGGSNPGGFDCSGLLQYVWAKQGVQIPRTTYEQYKAGIDVTGSQLRPGDAVFFEPTKAGPGHVGMFIGNGRFIESPHTGSSVRISNLAGRRDYVGARRYA
jgi:cell wall-associated NlpC family hydrolase